MSITVSGAPALSSSGVNQRPSSRLHAERVERAVRDEQAPHLFRGREPGHADAVAVPQAELLERSGSPREM